MLLNPNVQERAQAEIDAVVGSDRLPRLADRQNLPYLEACIKESLRWGPVTPEGLPHVARNDANYAGYFIPKGTIMIPNVWYLYSFWQWMILQQLTLIHRGMAHDPTNYPEPSRFRPERFLGATPAPNPDFAFGFGRRVCVGQHLAETSIFIFAVHVLALCDIKRAVGSKGQELDVEVKYEGEGIV
jgi:cytochrome P450